VVAGFYWSADRSQQMLFPPCVEDFLDGDHPVWFVLDLVDVIDLSGFHVEYVDGGVGRPAYDPAVMLGLLVWGYAHGLRSSRKIARACREDLAFMVICGGLRPDHRTIARFRQVHENALREVFYDVLRVCHECGLLQLGTIALDGTKIAADASLQQNRSKSWIAHKVEEILSEAAAADVVTQPDLDGELPAVLVTPGSRRARLVEALDQIHADEAAAAAEADAKAAAQRADAEQGRRPKGPRPSDPVAAVERAEIELVAAQARKAPPFASLAAMLYLLVAMAFDARMAGNFLKYGPNWRYFIRWANEQLGVVR
jgi:transposase